MEDYKIQGREREATPGNAKSLLDTVKMPEEAKSLSKDLKAKDVVEKIISHINVSCKYQKDIASKQVDATIEESRSMLNKLSKNAIKPAIDSLKKELSSGAFKTILTNVVANQIVDLFDDDAKKEDIEELKDWMQATFSKELAQQSSMTKDQIEQSLADVPDFSEEPISDAGPVEEDEVDEKEGDYQDSTSAKNFVTLQDFVNGQFDDLNKKLKNIPGQSGILSRISSSIGSGFSKIFGGLGKLSKGVMGGIGNIAKKTIGIFGVVGAVAGGIKKLGSKVGGAIAAPFKKVGGFFKSLNPFKKSEERAAERKQNAKDKIFGVMAKVLDKIWRLIEPFVDKVAFFMGLVTKFVIVPIAIIMANILLVVGAIIALGVAAYLAYSWIKEKIASFWKYITSGEMWQDMKKKFIEWWDWIVDFGKWLWDMTIKALKYIFCDMWIDLGKWVWEKLCQFGKWLYDTYIDPYIIQPFKKYIWEPVKKLWKETIWPTIKPFVDSLTNLYNRIKSAFSEWDTNKSIWENLKNIGGIIKDSIVEWWDGSPFKTFYDEHLQPIIQSLGDLIKRIKDVWSKLNWDENKSFIENLKGIGETLINAIREWWKSNDNPIRQKYNEYIKPIVSTIKEKLQPFIDKTKEIMQAAGNIVWNMKLFKLRPFGFLIGKSTVLSDEEVKQWENITKHEDKIADATKANTKLDKEIAELEARLKSGDYGRTLIGFKKNRSDVENELQKLRQEKFENDAEIILAKDELEKNKAKQLAQQQVGQAMKPIESIGSMKVEANASLSQEGNVMSQQMQEKEEAKEKYDANQYSMMMQMNENLKALNGTVEKNANNPTVVTVPTPVSQSPQHSASLDARPGNLAILW